MISVHGLRLSSDKNTRERSLDKELEIPDEEGKAAGLRDMKQLVRRFFN